MNGSRFINSYYFSLTLIDSRETIVFIPEKNKASQTGVLFQLQSHYSENYNLNSRISLLVFLLLLVN